MRYFVLIYLFLSYLAISTNVLAQDTSNDKLQGHVEGGLTIENGNSKTKSYYAKTKTNFTINEKWKNIFEARGENKTENKVRSKEEYRGNNQTRYSLTKLNYSFIELEYIDDRYGGYDYRVSQTLGLGRNLIKTDEISLTIQLGSGLRQSKFSDNDKEESLLARLGMNFKWQINSALSLNENLDTSFDDNGTITKSDTNLKIQIHKSLYFKFNLFIENKSDVPTNTKNTDTRAMMIIGYDF
jgi:putative salt-induced outer membrane protein